MSEGSGPSIDERTGNLHGDLRKLAVALVGSYRESLSPFEMGAPEYSILNLLSSNPAGAMTMREMGSLLPLDSGRMSSTATALAHRKLIRKSRLRSDQRVVRLTITEAGLSLMSEMKPRVLEGLASLLEGVSDEELHDFIAIGQKMIGDRAAAPAEMERASAGDAGRAYELAPARPHSSDRALQVGVAESVRTHEQARGERLDQQITDLQNTVIRLLNVMFLGIQERSAPFGLTVVEYGLLSVLSTLGPLTIKGISEHVPINAAQISRLVTKLADRNLVCKVRLKSDQRKVRVEMTCDGLSTMQELHKRVAAYYNTILARVTQEELARLLAFVEKFVANAEALETNRD